MTDTDLGILVVVTGGRGFGNVPDNCDPHLLHYAKQRAAAERVMIDEALSRLHRWRRIRYLIDGGARGADYWARKWREAKRVDGETMPADWAGKGRRAGPLRNAAMLARGPDFLVAFKGGAGTRNCIQQAEALGIEILRIGWE